MSAPVSGAPDEGVTVSGTVSGLQRRTTRKGRAWATATIQAPSGAVEVAVFPQTYAAAADVLADGVPVVVRGRMGDWSGAAVVYALQVSR